MPATGSHWGAVERPTTTYDDDDVVGLSAAPQYDPVAGLSLLLRFVQLPAVITPPLHTKPVQTLCSYPGVVYSCGAMTGGSAVIRVYCAVVVSWLVEAQHNVCI